MKKPKMILFDYGQTLVNEERFNGLPVYLFGHSWGGYAVCAVLRTNHKIKAVASVAGFNKPNIMIVEWAKRVAGKWAYIAIPFMKINQRLSFGKKMDITICRPATSLF